jgi:ribosomal-protein-alanine acetyltransferase
MSVTIRSAVADDVAAILDIERQAASAAHWTREQYDQRAAEGMILVSEEAQGISGFVCARVVAGEWEIENIVVAEQERRRGVAGGLLKELLRRARDQSGTAVWLEVRESNLPARRLYEKRGFREAGSRRGYYQNPVEDALLYELRLEGC